MSDRLPVLVTVEQLQAGLEKIEAMRRELAELSDLVRRSLADVQQRESDSRSPALDAALYKKKLRKVHPQGTKNIDTTIGFDPASRAVTVYPKQAMQVFPLLGAEIENAVRWMASNMIKGTHSPMISRFFAENTGRIMDMREVDAHMRTRFPNFWGSQLINQLRNKLASKKAPYRIFVMYVESDCEKNTMHNAVFGLFPAETKAGDLEERLADFK
ncbi:MAG: hypothetical protein UT33_C0007G0071 [Candidatus Peregrinibacteria bacterium GW2011_GWC2_39_14]|nr:MAG: hypothetical protein US92_C0002G0072 [Candidatus Peregrinibacteria bacterium GW2011_GWA2_38_36]KKR06883.1 MAG: hypothetical protein UT33_C0007G0071 [Candidatus Peregrinibacteria bacterium GW2011_GWC2_39_14]